jgi:DNA invertase Pin-like site-specific DNA recombinase
MDGRFVTYFRVSTSQRGRSGLGLEAQRAAVAAYLKGGTWTVVDELVEVELGKRADRPELARAIELSCRTGATLLIAKLGRLAHNARFLLSLQQTGVEFVACDMPHANRWTIGIMVRVAGEEAVMCSVRAKAALAASRERGTILGGYRGGPKVNSALGAAARRRQAEMRALDLTPLVRAMQAEGLSLRQMADRLTEQGIRTARGGKWAGTTVRNLLLRAG